MSAQPDLLLIGAFGPGALENYYVEGMERAGATVSTYDVGTRYQAAVSRSLLSKVIHRAAPAFLLRPLNRDLLRFLAGRRFDGIIVFKGMELLPETVISLKGNATVLANYNPDHPFRFYSRGSGNRYVLRSIRHYDAYFTYSSRIASRLQTDFHTASFVIPFGFDDVASAGTAAGPDVAGRILFVGAYDGERARLLNRVADDHLRIFGDLKWSSRTAGLPKVREAYQGRGLFGEEYKQAVAAAAGNINLLREQNLTEQSHNMRTFEVPGYGGVLITQRTTEQSEFFEEDKEILCFDSVEELATKTRFLIGHPDVAARMKLAARERSVKSGYSYRHRASELLGKLKDFL